MANVGHARNPGGILAGLDARIALCYLRAKSQRGIALRFAYERVRRRDARTTLVTVVISGSQDSALARTYVPATTEETRFSVLLERRDDAAWEVTRITLVD